MQGMSARPMEQRDLANVLSWRNHPDVRSYMRTRHEITMDEHVAWFGRASRDASRSLLIVEEAGAALGFAQFSSVEPDGVCEWGFYAVPGAARGSGSKLGRSALDHAFGPLKVRKVCGYALGFNEASIRLHERLGFQREGVLREHVLVDGQYYDVVLFGLLRDEWFSQV